MSRAIAKNIKTIQSAALDARLVLGRIRAVLAGVCAIAVLLYGIFLLEAVAHAAAQTAAQRQITALNAQLGDLEARYLSQSQSLTPQTAAQMGFVTPTQVSTVFATAAAGALSLRGQ